MWYSNENAARVKQMIISIASGKGGTGKTTIAVSLALALDKVVQLIDCDVEEPNTHIFTKPNITHQETVFIKIPQVNLEKCNFCHKCSNVCSFNAIAVVPKKVNIFPELCHSCGACTYFCPTQAITEVDHAIGVINFGEKSNIKFIQGKLNVGQAMPTPLIDAIKKHINHHQHAIIDAPPGTSCSMVHTVSNSDYCVLVTEPTPFGLNDLKLAAEVLIKLQIPFGVIINRCNIGNNSVEEYCKKLDIKILMRIPFTREIAENYAIGKPLVESVPMYKEELVKMFTTIEKKYGKTISNN